MAVLATYIVGEEVNEGAYCRIESIDGGKYLNGWTAQAVAWRREFNGPDVALVRIANFAVSVPYVEDAIPYQQLYIQMKSELNGEDC